jgi:hypothetical protein
VATTAQKSPQRATSIRLPAVMRGRFLSGDISEALGTDDPLRNNVRGRQGLRHSQNSTPQQRYSATI